MPKFCAAAADESVQIDVSPNPHICSKLLVVLVALVVLRLWVTLLLSETTPLLLILFFSDSFCSLTCCCCCCCCSFSLLRAIFLCRAESPFFFLLLRLFDDSRVCLHSAPVYYQQLCVMHHAIVFQPFPIFVLSFLILIGFAVWSFVLFFCASPHLSLFSSLTSRSFCVPPAFL